MYEIGLGVNMGKELKEYNSLFKEWNDVYHKIALKFGISDSEFLILYGLVELNLKRQKDISDYFCISKQTINSSVKKLVNTGIVELKAAKGRDMQIILTDDGRKFTEEKIIPVINIEKTSFTSMGEKDSKEFIRLTRKYLDIFKEQTKQIL